MPLEVEARDIYVQFLRVISLVQLTLGIAELLFGGLAVKFIEGTTEYYKIAMFTGVFIVGISMFLAGILSLLTGRKAAIFDAENHLALAWNAMECFVCSLHGLSISAISGTCLVVVAIILGSLQDCAPNICSYTAPFTGRKVIVIFIVSFLIVSTFVSVLTICYGCIYGRKCSMYCMVNKAKRSKTNYIEADSALYEKSDEFPHILITEATTSSINNSSSTTGSLATRTGSRTVKELQEQVQTQQEQLVWQQDQSPETIL